MLKEVRVNGADVTDTGLEFKAGEAVTGIEIVLTSKADRGQRQVSRRRGTQPVKDYTLVVFSDDPQHWTHAEQPLRRRERGPTRKAASR